MSNATKKTGGEKDESNKDSPKGKTTGLENDEEDADASSTALASPTPQNGILLPMNKESMTGQTSTCSMSTASASPNLQIVSASDVVQSQANMNSKPTSKGQSLQRNRESLTRQALILFALSSLSFFMFLVFSLPTMALVALGMFFLTTCLAFFTIFRRFVLEYQAMIHGRGVGDYLSPSLYHQLTETTLHDWMSDSTFFMEYRHLLLYYVPGVTNEQLEEMVDRLAPHHREILRRRGLGQLLGPEFMRLIMGDSRWHPNQSMNQVHQIEYEGAGNVVSRTLQIGAENEDTAGDAPPVRSITAEPLARRLDELSADDASELEPNSSESALRASEDSQLQSQSVSRVLFPGSTKQSDARANGGSGDDANLGRDLESEGQVLTDAISSMFMTYSRSFMSSSAQSLNQLAVQVVEYVSPSIIRLGMGITTLSASVGIVGVWYGAYYPWRMTTLTPRFPSGRSLLSAAFSGVTTAGVMIIARRGVRRYLSPNEETMNIQQETKSDKKSDV